MAAIKSAATLANAFDPPSPINRITTEEFRNTSQTTKRFAKSEITTAIYPYESTMMSCVVSAAGPMMSGMPIGTMPTDSFWCASALGSKEELVHS